MPDHAPGKVPDQTRYVISEACPACHSDDYKRVAAETPISFADLQTLWDALYSPDASLGHRRFLYHSGGLVCWRRR